MARTDQKWSEMVINDQNGQKWSKMVKNDKKKWPKINSNGQNSKKQKKMIKMIKIGQNGQKWTDFLGSQSSHDVFRGQNLETMRHGNKRFIFRSINQNVKRDFLPLAFDKFN